MQENPLAIPVTSHSAIGVWNHWHDIAIIFARASGKQKRKCEHVQYKRPFVRGISQWPPDSPNKRQSLKPFHVMTSSCIAWKTKDAYWSVENSNPWNTARCHKVPSSFRWCHPVYNGSNSNHRNTFICALCLVNIVWCWGICRHSSYIDISYIDGLVQERHNSSELAMEFRLSCNIYIYQMNCVCQRYHKDAQMHLQNGCLHDVRDASLVCELSQFLVSVCMAYDFNSIIL